MENIKNYIINYGNKTFIEKEINDLDSLIFSLLSYIDFRDIIPEYKKGSITLSKASKKVFEKYNKKNIKSSIIAVRNALEILPYLSKSKRFKNLKFENYLYIIDYDIQFGAFTINLPNNSIFISFEGTDNYISGWYEDFEMSYMFPTPAQQEAINYINKVVPFFCKSVYVGGHSKGGNLSLVASMYSNFLTKLKIKKIYSFDGPGLRIKQLKSLKYETIKNRYIHIVPNESIIGMLFNNEDNYIFVKSSKKLFFQHAALNWHVKDDKFVLTEQSDASKKFRKAMKTWLLKFNDDERKEFVTVLFSILNKAGIKDLVEFKKTMIPSMIKIVKETSNLSKETRKMMISCFTDLYNEWRS